METVTQICIWENNISLVHSGVLAAPNDWNTLFQFLFHSVWHQP